LIDGIAAADAARSLRNVPTQRGAGIGASNPGIAVTGELHIDYQWGAAINCGALFVDI